MIRELVLRNADCVLGGPVSVPRAEGVWLSPRSNAESCLWCPGQGLQSLLDRLRHEGQTGVPTRLGGWRRGLCVTSRLLVGGSVTGGWGRCAPASWEPFLPALWPVTSHPGPEVSHRATFASQKQANPADRLFSPLVRSIFSHRHLL